MANHEYKPSSCLCSLVESHKARFHLATAPARNQIAV